MKLASLLSAFIVASSAAPTWFDCEPSFFQQADDPTTALFDPRGERIRSLLRDYKEKEFASQHLERDFPYTSKCTILRPPLDHDNPTGPKIDLFLKCYSLSSSSTGVMFFLQGGPGGSGVAMEGLMDVLIRDVGDLYDFCTLDFRGVFRSNSLQCHANQAETPGSESSCNISPEEAKTCREGLQLSTDMAYFDTTQAAKDLKYAIDQYTPSKSKVGIYGVSYGTYWLGRYVQIFPDGADILIFDSVVNLAGSYIAGFHRWDEQGDTVLREYLKRCKSDAFCTSKMTQDPLDFATKTMNRVFADDSSCPEIKELFGTKQSFVSTLYGLLQRLEFRVAVLALFYRMDRCNSRDVQSLINLFSTSSENPSDCFSDFSSVIYYNVVSMDLFDKTLSLSQLQARGKELTFYGGISESIYEVAAAWTTLSNQQYYNKTLSPSASTRILVLGSDLDPQTIIESTVDFYNNLNVTANQAYLGVSVGGVHVTLTMGSAEQINCGFDITSEFIQNPGSKPNTNCLAETITDDYDGAFLSFLLGVDDVYESYISSSSLTSPLLLLVLALLSFNFI